MVVLSLASSAANTFATNIRVVEDTGVVAIYVAFGTGERNRVRARGEPGCGWEGVESSWKAILAEELSGC